MKRCPTTGIIICTSFMYIYTSVVRGDGTAEQFELTSSCPHIDTVQWRCILIMTMERAVMPESGNY